MKTILAEAFSRIDLGHRGEHLARQIVFDLAPWRALYGDGEASLLAQLPKASLPYPCSVSTDGDTLIWQIRSSDTSIAGKGSCELSYYVGEQLVKSAVFQTFIVDSLAEAGEVPPPYSSWVDDINQVKNETIAAKEAVESLSVSAETLPNGTEAAVSKEERGGHVHLTFSLPRGEKGEQGEKGDKGDIGNTGATPVRGVDYFTDADMNVFETYIDTQLSARLGDLEAALDGILTLQESLIGGDGA